MVAQNQVNQSINSKPHAAFKRINRFFEKHPAVARIVVLAVLPVVLAFAAREARSQSLLTPLNPISATKQLPSGLIAPNQLVYMGKWSADGNRTATAFFCLSDGQWTFGGHRVHEANDKTGNQTITNGAVVRHAKPALGGQLVGSARLAVAETGNGKQKTSSAVYDGALTALQPWNAPVMVTAGYGSNDAYYASASVCSADSVAKGFSGGVASNGWAASFTYKQARRADKSLDKSAAIGADGHIVHSRTVSQRIYASFERSLTHSRYEFICGSRFFVLNFTGESNVHFAQFGNGPIVGALSVRFTCGF